MAKRAYKKAQSRKITLYLFLFSIFLFLALFIGVRIYNIYMGSKTTSETTLKSTMGCAFVFSLTNIEYNDGTLVFSIKTSDENAFKKITIVGADGTKREVEMGTFMGYRQDVRVENINIENLFEVYPEGCESIKKECQLAVGKC